MWTIVESIESGLAGMISVGIARKGEQGLHRVVLAPGMDIDEHCHALNVAFVRDGFAALPDEEIEKIRAVASVVWTPEVIAAYIATLPQPESIDEVKARKWLAIKAERDRRQADGGVKVGGKWFLSSDREVGRYNSLITVANSLGLSGTTVLRAGWRTMDSDVTEDMTANLARSILSAGFSQFAAIDDAAQAHKQALAASVDPASYNFSTGWPPEYGE